MRDIRKRIAEAAEQSAKAARDEVRRVGEGLLRTSLGDTIRSLDLAREACRGKQWRRAGELCDLAREHLTRVLAQPVPGFAGADDLELVSRRLAELAAPLRDQPRNGVGDGPPDVLEALTESIVTLHRLDGRRAGVRQETLRGPETR